ncbi:hypothetical protein SAMN04489765_4368 [Tsukamurella pulmonis]|uniref:Uncharacterized protein n=1 Tax=Tsukamurella pulmonis TaxID=47312 RepID=A0A1H1HMC5_9ACTN|nr:hypothetical protein [Tsukamurella pulmonis]SDR26574.1 hypothetical protein SAMN04489765_4368 [Tsukamurella pulmonis]SUP14000.1 Uncharacterised protein [Tsukamurella pulmonis]
MAATAHARGNPVPTPGDDPSRAATAPDGSLVQLRLQGAFLTVIGLAGMFGGVMFSIEAPRFTPVPVVFLTFWLIMVIVGRIFFTGLSKLRSAGVSAPAPEQVRAAAAVAGIVVAVGMMGFAATGPGAGVASAAPCPGGGPATCGPGPGPELTITPPAQQTTAPGGQQGNQGSGQDNNGIATSPAGSGGNDGGNIQAQTPDFGAPGQQAPNIPGNPTGQAQQPAQSPQTGQQNPVRTTAPGRPTPTGQPTRSGQPTSGQPTVTVTQTQSECPAPGVAGAPGAGGPGGGVPGGDDGTTGGPDGDGKDEGGAPSWAYLVAEAAGVIAGRRRNTGGSAAPAEGTVREATDRVGGRAAPEGNTARETTDRVSTGSGQAVTQTPNSESQGGSDQGSATSQGVTLASADSPLASGSSEPGTAQEILEMTGENIGLTGDPLAIANSTATGAGNGAKTLAPAAQRAASDAASKATAASERAASKPWYNPTKVADKASSAVNSAKSSVLGKAGSALGAVAKRAPGMSQAITVVQVANDITNKDVAPDKAIVKGGASLAGAGAGAWAGAKAGAAIGTFIPIPGGTLVGGAVGAIAGGVIGSGATTAIVDKTYDGAKALAGKAASGIGKAASKLKFW